MKILEMLEKYSDTMPIKVGSASGFWYVGTAGDFRNNVSDINSVVKQYNINRVVTAKDSLQKTIKNWPTPTYYVSFELKKPDYELSLKGYMKMLADWLMDVAAADSRVKLWEDRVEHYIPIQKREIKDCGLCDPSVDKGVIRIALEGYEPGKFWTTDEAVSTPCIKFVAGDGAEAEE